MQGEQGRMSRTSDRESPFFAIPLLALEPQAVAISPAANRVARAESNTHSDFAKRRSERKKTAVRSTSRSDREIVIACNSSKCETDVLSCGFWNLLATDIRNLRIG